MSDRQSRFQRDLSAVVTLCSASDFIEVADSSDEVLVLMFKSAQEVSEYTLNFSADYPDGTVVCSSKDATLLKTTSEPLTTIFTKICNEWCSKHEVSMPDLPWESNLVQSMDVEAYVTQVSVASSEFTEASDGDDGDDYDEYDLKGSLVIKRVELRTQYWWPAALGCAAAVAAYDIQDMTEEAALHSLLETEVAAVQKAFGDNAIECRIHAGIDEMDVFFYIDLNNFLDNHTATAWGVKLSEPLVILLHIRSVCKYLDGLEPQVDVFQASPSSKGERRKVGLGSQMKKIMQTFVSQQWKSLSNVTVEKMLSSNAQAVAENQQQKKQVSQDQMIAQMMEMGFSAEDSLDALKSTSNDLEQACMMLTQRICNTAATAVGDTATHSSSVESSVDPIPIVRRQESMGAQIELTDKDEDPQVDKEVPALNKGFLAQCLQYALNRIHSLNEFCVICDEKHVLETGLIKPCVCTRELCVFAFQTLGVMADAAEAIATDADVVDLLIAMANAAAHSSRANLILDPYPSVVDPVNPSQFAMDPKKKDFEHVKTVMAEVVASRDNLLRGRASNLKQDLDEHNKLAFPLMQWIIATCRAHIVLLPEDRQIKSMKTKYQFLLISSPPGKEVGFQQAKAKNGSTFAFHGSNIENWHSIMRKGLINASGTKYQLHGAAYGSGIYLSPSSGVSFGYTSHYGSSRTQSAGKKDNLAGKLNLKCLALCEAILQLTRSANAVPARPLPQKKDDIVTSKGLKKSGDIWVCPNSDHVCTRFFFVYEENVMSLQKNLDSRTADFQKEISHAVAHISAFKKR